MNDPCWCCTPSDAAHDSHYTCPRCRAHGARKGPMPEYAMRHMREMTKQHQARWEREQAKGSK